ncbi:3-hydroxyacyl-CoA dehydrogenase/enoyl-CoA hydratase family protein [Deinococcus peraridilitoris]|uniref:3-hydroxyacyl-CoA dehydrogenase n=1 Tax=Deinococcus peraridilitoris (strain DSM 19664 / LMG 22246 / CIP 109416 / KR-200) TaxID=937777 RepID=L0A5R4_DEIPD|nr:3-hydroxyacyl-CoA dehydrogenase/enoyl-CoA hydratase family protein [Deinococcus peraridilitoris]AFZ69223.1 3-hydroxyacyl-CoA dehydrogenase [Deinococcus peraridilitoris DSM 19664]
MKINTAAVIGAGTMGAAIAAQLANAGIPTLLLDIVLPDQKDRNFLARAGLERALKSRPAAFMDADNARLITVGNLEDDFEKLAGADWIVEAIIEKLDAKRDLWARVEQVAKPGAIISSNSSGIPMHLQIVGRSEEFQRRFVGAHFFNPPRYLHLMEVIPTPKTAPEVVEAFSAFGDVHLGKGIVVANDVPGFVANRIGVYGMIRTMHHMARSGLTPDVVDVLTGPAMGRPKSASFRTADLSGLDIIYHVGHDLDRATGGDEDFTLPEFLVKLVEEKKWLGDKTGSGFYKKTKENGKTVILTLNLNTYEYENKGKVRLASLEPIRNLPLNDRLKALYALSGPEGDFLRGVMHDGFWYSAKMAGVVSERITDIDNALKWGFGWEQGPFETMDVLGVQNVIAALEAEGRELPPLLSAMKHSGRSTFYHDGTVPDPQGGVTHYEAPFLILKDLKKDATKIVRSSQGASLLDVGDGVLLLEFHSKMNALGEDALRMVSVAHQTVQELGFAGLVVGNQGENFSAGANLALLLMNAQDGEFDEIDLAVRQFQKAITSLRFSPHPTVVAPFHLTLGGGCEMALHADHVQASAETYMGLVEVGVGLIPGGGGTKEMLLRFTDALLPGQPLMPALQRAFELIGTAKTSTSAQEARRLGFLRDSDEISMNRDRLIEDAKRKVLELAPGYVQPVMREDIRVMGEQGIAAIKAALYGMVEGGQISEYDREIGLQVARVLSGGALVNRNARVSEQYLLDLEREAFLTLSGKRKTQERIAHTLKTGKPLRN